MKINSFEIDRMGGVVTCEMEPNTPDILEINEVEVITYLFDGYGVFTHNNKYYKISYDKLEDVKDDEQILRTINEYRYGNRPPDASWDITVDDMALTFGEVEECEYSEYVSYLIDGLISNASNLTVEDGEREVLSPDYIASKLREIKKTPPKYLYYFTDRDDLVEQFDGEIYPVYDENKRDDENQGWICDVLLEDLLVLEKQGIIKPDPITELNEPLLTSEEHRAKLLATRFEAIIFLKDRTYNERKQDVITFLVALVGWRGTKEALETLVFMHFKEIIKLKPTEERSSPDFCFCFGSEQFQDGYFDIYYINTNEDNIIYITEVGYEF